MFKIKTTEKMEKKKEAELSPFLLIYFCQMGKNLNYHYPF